MMHLAQRSGLMAHPVTTDHGNRPRVQLPYCLPTGAHLFHDGDACTGLYAIRSGVFRLSRLTRGGRRTIVGFGFPGDILGYGSDGRHISDCEALGDARVIRHRPEILHNNRAEPHLRRALLQGALRQVETVQDHCMMLGRNTARDRVAAFLAFVGERLGAPLGQYLEFELPMPRTDIADYLGLTTETVSRSLTELRNAGLIAIENVYHVILLDPKRLDALAEGEAA